MHLPSLKVTRHILRNFKIVFPLEMNCQSGHLIKKNFFLKLVTNQKFILVFFSGSYFLLEQLDTFKSRQNQKYDPDISELPKQYLQMSMQAGGSSSTLINQIHRKFSNITLKSDLTDVKLLWLCPPVNKQKYHRILKLGAH